VPLPVNAVPCFGTAYCAEDAEVSKVAEKGLGALRSLGGGFDVGGPASGTGRFGPECRVHQESAGRILVVWAPTAVIVLFWRLTFSFGVGPSLLALGVL
jgi:hypothetical protein